jgi:hypothetical protein
VKLIAKGVYLYPPPMAVSVPEMLATVSSSPLCWQHQWVAQPDFGRQIGIVAPAGFLC